MDFINLVSIAVGLFVAMTAAWAIQRMTGASGWIDTIWSLAVGIGGIAAALLADGAFERRMMVLVLVALWSLRLTGHIGARTRGAGEDPRYAKLIEEWGSKASLRLFLFLQIQAVAAFVLVLALYAAATNPAPWPGFLDLICLVIAVVALAGEATADLQLSRFRKTPQAKTDVCETGLWAYSRHPNYFFEWLFWCAWPLAALPSPVWAIVSLLAPIMMYWLLVHVSGIPPLEDHMLKSRGEKFRALQGRVNAFFPGPRKSSPVTQGPITPGAST
jgi:steroid 5-alpha reductase family enzyme